MQTLHLSIQLKTPLPPTITHSSTPIPLPALPVYPIGVQVHIFDILLLRTYDK